MLYELSWERAAQALGVACDLGSSVYDAYYVLLANKLRVPLVAADKPLYKTARKQSKLLHIKDYLQSSNLLFVRSRELFVEQSFLELLRYSASGSVEFYGTQRKILAAQQLQGPNPIMRSTRKRRRTNACSLVRHITTGSTLLGESSKVEGSAQTLQYSSDYFDLSLPVCSSHNRPNSYNFTFLRRLAGEKMRGCVDKFIRCSFRIIRSNCYLAL